MSRTCRLPEVFLSNLGFRSQPLEVATRARRLWHPAPRGDRPVTVAPQRSSRKAAPVSFLNPFNTNAPRANGVPQSVNFSQPPTGTRGGPRRPVQETARPAPRL